jgi:hypothetical protein
MHNLCRGQKWPNNLGYFGNLKKNLPRVNKGENSPNMVTLVKSMIVVKDFYTEKDFSVVRPTLRHTTKIRRFSSCVIPTTRFESYNRKYYFV